MPLLLLIFIILPAIEITLFIEVGGLLGALPTLSLVFLSAFFGLLVMRKQGFSTFLKAREKMATGEAPVNEMIEGYLLALSGLLLFVPGFFTDGLGILLLIPPCRRKMANWALKKAASSQSTFFRYGQSDAFHTFEGEFTREQEKQNPIEHDKR